MGSKSKGFRLRRALFPAGYYGSNAVYQGYISLYYTHLGFHSAQLGMISAATAAAALIAQPVWGRLGDRTRSRRRLLCILCLLSAASLPLALPGRSFAAQILAAMAFYAFFCALLPLGDAILLQTRDGAFGAYRLAGGASFAIAGAAFGAARGWLGPGGAIWISAGLILLTALAALALPDSPGEQRGGRGSMIALLRDRTLLRMLAFVLPLQMTMGYFHTFHAPHFKSLAGGSDALLGLGYLISAVSEAPYLLLSGRIYRRFGAEKPMCIAALILALRWAVLGGAESAIAALLSQILHGGGFIVITVSMAHWIADHVPEEMKASGQALLNMVSFGAARVTGNLLGGMLAKLLGQGRAFFGASALCALALAAFLPGVLRRR